MSQADEAAERVDEIRRRFYATFPNPEILSGETATAIRDLLAYIDALLTREREARRLEREATLTLAWERDWLERWQVDEIKRARQEVTDE